MKVRVIPLLLSFLLLLQQLPLYAVPKWDVPRRPAAADNTAVHFQKVLLEQIAEASISRDKAQRLDISARQALLKGDIETFKILQRKLTDVLLSLLRSPLSQERVYALQRLSARLREGLLDKEESKQLFLYLRQTLLERKKCSTEAECEVVGLSALTLALSAAPENLSLPEVESGKNSLSGSKARLTNLYLALLKNDYGSSRANAALAPYFLQALGYTGGTAYVQLALENFIKESKRLPLLWGHASVPGGNYYLNRYDVANAPAQKAAIQVLASLGEEGKKTLEFYAAQNRSLVSYVHANIELAYLGKTSVPVFENLARLYCHQVWHLDSQKDFELKKELAYAYGHGSAPAYIYKEGDKSCRVTVPQTPNPRLVLQERTEAVMGEVLFNAAFLGAGEFFNVLRYTRKLARAAKTRMSASVRKAPKTLPASSKSIRPVPVLPRRAGKPVPVLAADGPNTAPTALDPKTFGSPSNSFKRTYVRCKLENYAANPHLSRPQKNHIAYLRDKVNAEPLSAADLEEAYRGTFSLPLAKDNAFSIYGPEMADMYTNKLQKISKNFLTRNMGFVSDPKQAAFPVTLPNLLENILKYGEMSPNIFIQWNTHGLLHNNAGWRSLLAPQHEVNMREIASFVQQIISGGHIKTATLFMDSCYGGTAFKEFLKLPEALKKNINLFTPVGRLELNYVLNIPSPSFRGLSPLEYAYALWQESFATHGIMGQAYVNGKAIRPLDLAIKQAAETQSPLLPKLQVLRQVSLAETPEEMSYLYERLLKNGIRVESMGMNPKGHYIVLPEELDFLPAHPPAYILSVPLGIREMLAKSLIPHIMP